ncbi:MAG: TonB-dependent receptor [Pseudomonadota bacterium]|nr:TonB-dependent receptor [Pseudomonadota bacterium]
MNSLARILTALPLTASAAVPVALAGPETADRLDPVVVSGTRFPHSVATTPASIHVIDREQIEASGATNIAQLLRGRGGVQVNDIIGDGSRTVVSLRGFGANASANTLVLVDGRRLNNSDLQAPDFNTVALKDVERIEIVQGSAGTLFGDQAVGGVVNIITRPVSGFRAAVDLGGGSFDQWSRSVSLANVHDNGLFYRISAGQLDSDNYRDNNRQDRENLLAKTGWRYEAGELFVEVQRVDESLELAGTLFVDQLAADRRQAANPGDQTGTDTDVWRIGIDHEFSRQWRLLAEVTDRDADTRATISFGGLPTAFTSSRDHRAFNPRLLGTLPLAAGDLILTLGADVEDTEFRTLNIFGNTRNEQEMWSLYAQAVVPVTPRWRLTLGGRYAEVENDLIDGGPFGAFPGGIEFNDEQLVGEVGLSFQASDDWRLFVRADENYRFALANEQTFTPPGLVGLDTQTGWSFEAGAEWRRGPNHAKALLYLLDLDDEIDFNPLAGFFGANQNLEETRRIGVVLEGRYALSERFALNGQYSYTDAEFRSGVVKGREVPFVAEHSGRLALELLPMAGITGLLEFQAISDRVASGDYTGSVADQAGYGVCNATLAYTRGAWRFSVRGDNLFDKEYRELAISASDPVTFLPATAYFPAPQRRVRFNLRYQLD